MNRNRNLLLVDDEPLVTKSLARVFNQPEFRVFTANSALEAMSIMSQNDIGVMVSDISMPRVDGVSLCVAMNKKRPGTVQILLTGKPSLESAVDAINRLDLFGYLTKPWEESHLRHIVSRAFDHYDLIEANKRLQTMTREQNRELKAINAALEGKIQERTHFLEQALNEGILMLAKAAEAKDLDSGDHVNRIMGMTEKICEAMALPIETTRIISSFSRIHDVGKLHISDHILNKSGPLTDEEWRLIRRHPVLGEKIISDLPFYRIAREIARSHHENWNGTGYPDGLSGEAIPLSARIVAVADVYDALTNKRPYKPAWRSEDALREMKNLTGVKFDPVVMEALLTKVMKG
jgi:putative two-component system response regulator